MRHRVQVKVDDGPKGCSQEKMKNPMQHQYQNQMRNSVTLPVQQNTEITQGNDNSWIVAGFRTEKQSYVNLRDRGYEELKRLVDPFVM